MRCGVTPTDAMHILGDFTMYSQEAAYMGIYRLGRMARTDVETFAKDIYKAVEKKLYVNLSRILLEERYKDWRKLGIPAQMEEAISDLYDSEQEDFLELGVKCNAALIGVGAPTHVFLPRVGAKLGAKVVMPEYAAVANALGAIVGNVVTRATIEVVIGDFGKGYILLAKGLRESFTYLEDAKIRAKELAEQLVREENESRGGASDIEITYDEQENVPEAGSFSMRRAGSFSVRFLCEEMRMQLNNVHS